MLSFTLHFLEAPTTEAWLLPRPIYTPASLKCTIVPSPMVHPLLPHRTPNSLRSTRVGHASSNPPQIKLYFKLASFQECHFINAPWERL